MVRRGLPRSLSHPPEDPLRRAELVASAELAVELCRQLIARRCPQYLKGYASICQLCMSR
jgi:hypothetical protein